MRGLGNGFTLALQAVRVQYIVCPFGCHTFSVALACLLCQQAGQSEEAIREDWKEKLEEGEEALALSSMDTSISNLEVFCYARYH